MVEVAIRLAAPCQLAVPQMLSPANIRYTRALQGLPVTFCNAKRASRIANSPAWGVHVYSSTLWAMGFPLARGSNVTDVTNSICGGVPCLEDHPRYCGILTPAFQPTKKGVGGRLLSQRILRFIDPKTGPLGSGSLLVLPFTSSADCPSDTWENSRTPFFEASIIFTVSFARSKVHWKPNTEKSL